jgi:IS30 family transposase
LDKAANRIKNFGKVAPKAMAAALNRTISTVKADMKREATAEYEIKSADVAKTLRVKRASAKRLYASAISEGRPVALIHFKVKPKKPPTKRATGYVQVKVKKSGGYTALKGERAGFVQNMNGGINVYQRETKKHLPVKRLYSLSIPQMISNKEVIARINKKAHETLEKRLEHEVNYRLEKLAKKG